MFNGWDFNISTLLSTLFNRQMSVSSAFKQPDENFFHRFKSAGKLKIPISLIFNLE